VVEVRAGAEAIVGGGGGGGGITSGVIFIGGISVSRGSEEPLI
jgi:hypothetical protein